MFLMGFFNLNLTEKGLYTILFNNRALGREVKLTLIMNSGQNLVEKEKLSESEKKLDTLLEILQKFEQDNKLKEIIEKEIDIIGIIMMIIRETQIKIEIEVINQKIIIEIEINQKIIRIEIYIIIIIGMINIEIEKK